MMLLVVCLISLMPGLSAEAWDKMNKPGNYSGEKAPLFELPCMSVGGTCAKPERCPLGLKVAQLGLCPEQARFGVECCRPRLKNIFFEQPCMRVGGFCADSCPPPTRVVQAGLCPDQQIFGVECCISYKRTINCCLSRKECVPNTFECSQFSISHQI